MEEFIEAYIFLLTDDDEVVDRYELINYCNRKQIDQMIVSDCIKKFDLDQNGKISLEEFCRGMGVTIEDIRLEKQYMDKAKNGQTAEISPDVKIITSKMCHIMQYEITEHFKKLINSITDEKDYLAEVPNKMKLYLDKHYNRVWQVVVVKGSYWMNFTHEPFKSIQFAYDKYACLAWRTPKY